MRRSREYWEQELNKAGRRLSAAQGVLEGRFSEFMASLQVGSEEERRMRRDDVHSAYDALLDAFEFNQWIVLEKNGVDPRRRHL